MLRIGNNNKNQRKMTEIKVNKERARKKKREMHNKRESRREKETGNRKLRECELGEAKAVYRGLLAHPPTFR